MAEQHPFKYGRSTIVVEEDDFTDGYMNGYAVSPGEEDVWSVEALHRLIMECVSDTKESPAWNIGCLLGAIKAIYDGTPLEEGYTPSVQLGPITLRLNRWRFHDGYWIGRQDYAADQDDRHPSNVLTAHELLSYIAHRDPATQTYYLGPDEVSAFEVIIGQLVGYLCAALFPQTGQDGETEQPPSSTVLQEA
jgi:hypothetical protein